MTRELKPFRQEDLTDMQDREGEQIESALIARQAQLGPAFTFWVNGQPVGCAGVVVLWPGVGAAWMVWTEAAESSALWITKLVKRFLDDMTMRYQIHRFEAVVLECSTRNQAWIERLGFTREAQGVARHLLPDRRSMVRYERIGA